MYETMHAMLRRHVLPALLELDGRIVPRAAHHTSAKEVRAGVVQLTDRILPRRRLPIRRRRHREADWKDFSPVDHEHIVFVDRNFRAGETRQESHR